MHPTLSRLLAVAFLTSLQAGALFAQCGGSVTASYDPTAAQATYTFSSTGNCGTAQIQVARAFWAPDDWLFYQDWPTLSQTEQHGTECLADGTYTLDFIASCYILANGQCNRQIEPWQYNAASITVNNTPSVSATLSPRAGSTVYDGTIIYSFPNTSSGDGHQRHLFLSHIDPLGQSTTVWDSFDNWPINYIGAQTGSFSFTFNTACWPEGPHQLVPVASHNCANSTKTGSPQTITIQRRPVITAGVTKNPNGSNHVVVDYQFFDSGASREITLTMLPTPRDASSQAGDYTGLGMQGTITADLTVDSDRTMRITATNGSCYSADTTVGLSASCCSAGSGGGGGAGSYAGDPVRVWDGAVSYSERDPLPDDFGLLFRRTYQSYSQQSHFFGVGWLSAFDGGIAVADTPQHKSVVVYTEDNDHAVFDQLANGAWLQTWPAGTAARGTLSGSESTGYSYRQAGSSIVRLYGGSGSHHFLGFKDIRTGRQVTITYDSSGTPTAVADSFGVWASTLTADTSHRITQVAVNGRSDLVWNYAYDSAGNLTSVTLTGTSNAWRTYGYVQAGSGWYLASVADALGNLLEQHAYDSSGRAITSLGPSGDITNIQYSNTDPSTTIITRADNSTTTYTQSMIDHEVTTQLSGGCASCGGHDLTTAYDAFGHPRRVQDGRGYITESLYDQGLYGTRNLISETRALRPSGCDPATDPAHCALTSSALAAATLVTTSASQTTTYTYRDSNFPDRPTEIDRESVMVPANHLVETFTFDAATGQTLTHAMIGATGSDSHQESHTTTTALYNGTEGAAFDPGGSFQAAWLTAAQPSGIVKSVKGPRTDADTTTRYVYYPIGSSAPAASQGRLAAVKNALGQITRFENYDVFGHATTITDPNGVQSMLTFDALGRVLTSTLKGVSGCDTAADPLCATDLVSTNSYANVTGPLSLAQRPNANATAYTYDSRGRIAAMLRGTALSNCTQQPCISKNEQIVYTYDAATQKKTSESYQAWVNGAWSETTRESFSYDGFGRLAKTTYADNSAILCGYDGTDSLTSVQDERHGSPNTTYAFDPARRLAAVTQTLGTGNISTSYGYDVRDNLVSVTDPNGNQTTYNYDDFGRMLKQTSPVTGVTSYSYDFDGNVLTSSAANGTYTNRTYDVLGRVTQAASPGETVTWGYDGAAPFSIGRMTSMTDPAGSSAYKYDRRGLLLNESRTDTATIATAYQYDADGNRSAITYPSGLSAQYVFDYAHRPTSMTAAGGTTISAASYLPFGPLTTLTYGNGMKRIVTFDNRYRVTENKLTLSSGAAIADYTYAEDAVGNITQIHDAIDPTFNRDFAYDDLNRLVTANSGSSLWGSGSYTYDNMGNMLTLDLGGMIEVDPNQPLGCKTCRARGQAAPAPGSRHEIYAYQGTTPMLDHVTSVTLNTPAPTGTDKPMTYDAAGNETHYFADRTYSGRNLLATVSDNSGDATPAHQVTYGYDGRGVRVSRTELPVPAGSATRRYYYTPELHLLTATTDDQQNIWRTRLRATSVATSHNDILWFDNLPVVQVTDGNTWRGTFTDHLGTPILQFDVNGTVTWQAEYEPYGDLWQLRVGNSRYDQPLRFPGQEVALTWEGHEENYNIFRWYQSGLARYSQPDPIGLDSDINLYAYANKNPLTNWDSLGLQSAICCELAKKISDAVNELSRRAAEEDRMRRLIEENVIQRSTIQNLRQYLGHRQAYKNRQRNLRKLLKKWDDNNCGDPPTGGPAWATRPYPGPGYVYHAWAETLEKDWQDVNWWAGGINWCGCD